ncbi:MAG: GGDEF domain-containing protein [Aeromonadales bacterium]|nr:GGDEF domain-containing protein [Aeromonadales bacterium]
MEFKQYWSDNHHSADFKLIRIGFVAIRFRWLVTLLIIGITGWALVDWWMLDAAHFKLLWQLRLITAVSLTPLLPLSYLCKLNRNWMLLSLYLLLSILLVFNLISVWSFNDATPLPAVYQAFPYLLLALLAVLPFPLRLGLQVAGLITISVLASDYWLDPDSLHNGALSDRLWLLLSFSVAMLWVQIGQLRTLLDLYLESSRDPLTRLMNRRLFLRQLEQVRHQSSNTAPYVMMLLDIDQFKRVNDEHGHVTGDEVLVNVATTIADIVGQEAIVARFGGDEFVVLLRDTDLANGLRQAETLRLAVESQPVASSLNEQNIAISISVGVVEGHAQMPTKELIQCADQALYRAKRQGRNCVASYPSNNQ